MQKQQVTVLKVLEAAEAGNGKIAQTVLLSNGIETVLEVDYELDNLHAAATRYAFLRNTKFLDDEDFADAADLAVTTGDAFDLKVDELIAQYSTEPAQAS
jgi:hypothetical protein